MQWAATLAMFHARNGDITKGETVLKTGATQAKNAQEKASWMMLRGNLLAPYNANQAMQIYEQAAKLHPANPAPLKAMAGIFAKVGRWPDAVKLMTAYAEKRPADIVSRKTLIHYRLNGRQYDKAEAELEAILKQNPTDAQAMILKSILLRLQGRPARAITVATAAIGRHPEFAPALLERAKAYAAIGELDMAVMDIQAARKISDKPQASMSLAGMYLRSGKTEKAIAVLESIITEHERYEAAWRQLIDVHLKAGNWTEAEEALSKARKLFPRLTRFPLAAAGMWKTRKQDAKALAALKAAFELDKDSAVIVRAYLLELLGAERYDKALATAEPYKARASWSAWINAVIARVMVARKQDQQATELFAKSVENSSPRELPFVVSQIREAYGPKFAIEKMVAWSSQRPGDWYIKLLVGDLCSGAVNDRKIELSDDDRKQYLKLAIDSYETAVSKVRKPQDVASLTSRLAKSYYDAGQFAKAEKAYLKCLEITPDNPAALNNLAYLYLDNLNSPEKALPYARKVIRLMPQDPNVLDTYGWLMAKLRKYPEAKKYLLRAIERAPEKASYRHHLGWVLEQSKQTDEAMKQYRTGLKLIGDNTHTPTYKLLKDAIERIKK